MVLTENQFQKLYVLPVLGTNFKPYRELLIKLGIKVIVRTDNDIYKNDIHGLKRCLKLIDLELEMPTPEYLKGVKSEPEKELNEKKLRLHKEFYPCIEKLKIENDIYLAEIDLENDLISALVDAKIFKCLLGNVAVDLDELKSELQNKKWHNMFLFLKENKSLLENIFEDVRFDFLQRVKLCLS